MTAAAHTSIDRRSAVATGLALAAGVGIALADSSPHWDDTGVTVFALLIGAALTAGLGRRRPWLYALLVGGFVPLLEIPEGVGGASLIALLFAAVGAGVGDTLGSVVAASL